MKIEFYKRVAFYKPSSRPSWEIRHWAKTATYMYLRFLHVYLQKPKELHQEVAATVPRLRVCGFLGF
eukprot:4495867-Pyramimonas_sp.AAC.1